MSVNVWYAAVRKQRLCYRCLGKGHAIKDCKVKACGINRCTKKHNQLLHSEKQIDEGNHAEWRQKMNTCAFPDSESTVLFIDQRAREVTSQRHPYYAQRSWDTQKISKSRNYIQGCIRSKCFQTTKFFGKHKLRVQQAEEKLFECFTEQKLQPNGNWQHPRSECL